MTPQRARVELRSPAPADRDEFLAAMRASRKLHRPWLQSPVTDEAYDELLVRVQDERYDPLFVCLRDGGAIVGYMNISQIVRGAFQNAFLGYGAVAAYAGQGYMSEGLQLVLARAFAGLRLHRLEANIQPGNAASIALVHKAGFVREGFAERYLKIGGRWRDHEHWVIRAEQWRARSRRPSRS
jgi:[ribosomal protein S5]-alanine N-acetyltransferase